MRSRDSSYLFISVIVCPWLDVGLPPRCPQMPFSATLAQVELAECDQLRKTFLKCSAMAGRWTRAMEKRASEIHSFSHWAIMTRATGKTDSEIHSFSQWGIKTWATERADSEIHSFSHWAIMTRATERADSEIHSFSHWAIMTRATERIDSEIYIHSPTEQS